MPTPRRRYAPLATFAERENPAELDEYGWPDLHSDPGGTRMF